MRMMNDVGMLQMAVTVVPLLAKVLIVAGMIGLMLWMQWQLALIAVAVFPLFCCARSRWAGGCGSGQKQRRRKGR